MNQGMHWACDLIGRPYSRGSVGPDSFDCWSLVRYVFQTVHGIDMPVIAVGQHDADTPDNVASIKRAAAVSGWKPSEATTPAEHDIVLMSGIEGRHVGVMVAANGSLLLLHCMENVGVCVQPVADLARMGFHGFVYWRREA